MTKRIDIEGLVQRYTAVGLAHKLGVHVRTVLRWRNETVDPSPLALEKLRALPPTTDQSAGSESPAGQLSSQPTRQPLNLPTSVSKSPLPTRRIS
jgi:hypothetical protein